MRERFVCTHCFAELPLSYFWMSEQNPMADRFNLMIEEVLSGLREKGKGIAPTSSEEWIEPYTRAVSLYLYQGGFKKISQQLKYSANLALGRCFSRILGEKLAVSGLFWDVDMVIPVPLNWKRLWSRGYNQAEIIAKEVADVLEARIETQLLRRCRNTRSQTTLSVEEKARNVTGAFTVNLENLAKVLRCTGVPCSILLVDDVFTTGSTIFSCWKELRDGTLALGLPPSSVRIGVATLAYVKKD